MAEGGDVIGSIVFGGAEPTPERLATAMVVMLRSQGMPARLVLGYLPGDRSWLSGELEVRHRDAYSWVEAWLGEGGGWFRFDPGGLAPAVGAGGESTITRAIRFLLGAWVLWAAAALALVVWLVWRRVRGIRRMRPPTLSWAGASFGRLTRAGADLGRPRALAETPAEYARALAEAAADPRLAGAGALLTREAWSPGEPNPADRSAAEQAIADLEARARAERARRRRERWFRRRGRSRRGRELSRSGG